MQTFTFAASAAFLLASFVPAQNGSLTVIHGIPGLPAPVDVVANGASLFQFDYRDIEGPLSLPAGSYNIEVRLQGTTVLQTTANVMADTSYAAIAHLDASGNNTLSLFVDDTSNLTLPASRLTVRHTAQAPAVDVVIEQNGSIVTTVPNVSNGNSAGLDVAPGRYETSLFVAGTSNRAFGPVSVVVENGYSYGVYAVGNVVAPNFGLVIDRADLAARLTVVHGIPGLPAPVDVLANNAQLFSFDYKDVRGPLVVNPGTYALDVQLNGQSVLNTSATVRAGDAFSIVAHLDANGGNTLSLFADDLSATTDEVTARLTVRHLAQAPAVDLALDSIGGSRLATIPNLTNGQEATTDFAGGVYDVSLFAAGTTNRAFGPARIKPTGGFLEIYYAVGSLTGGSFDIVAQTIDTAPAVPGSIVGAVSGQGCIGSIGVSPQSFGYGEPFEVSLRNGPANMPALIAFGDSNASSAGLSLPFDLSPLGATGCFLYTNQVVAHPAALDANGSFDIGFRVPTGSFGGFQQVFAQVYMLAPSLPAGLGTSDLLTFTAR